jgi:uncharacterized lipoprotein YajG
MQSTRHRIFGSALVLATLALAAGCAPQQPPSSAGVSPSREAAAHDSVSRTTAIQNAQRDAAFRYAEVQIARVDARRQGAFWVVELVSTNGSGVRYTISAHDGSIRERNLYR